MYTIITCKYEMERIKNVRENVMTPFFTTVTLSVAMETIGRIWPNFELIQALIHEYVYKSHKSMRFFHTLKGS